jgi:2-haloacid dehalogenase
MTEANKKPIVIAFDAYGTLLSTASIATQLQTFFGHGSANKIAVLWRRYQLEYTWRLNSMGEFEATTRHLSKPQWQ